MSKNLSPLGDNCQIELGSHSLTVRVFNVHPVLSEIPAQDKENRRNLQRILGNTTKVPEANLNATHDGIPVIYYFYFLCDFASDRFDESKQESIIDERKQAAWNALLTAGFKSAK